MRNMVELPEEDRFLMEPVRALMEAVPFMVDQVEEVEVGLTRQTLKLSAALGVCRVFTTPEVEEQQALPMAVLAARAQMALL